MTRNEWRRNCMQVRMLTAAMTKKRGRKRMRKRKRRRGRKRTLEKETCIVQGKVRGESENVSEMHEQAIMRRRNKRNRKEQCCLRLCWRSSGRPRPDAPLLKGHCPYESAGWRVNDPVRNTDNGEKKRNSASELGRWHISKEGDAMDDVIKTKRNSVHTASMVNRKSWLCSE